jgi:hypothetical protein
MAIAQMLMSQVESAMGRTSIETNLRQFLLVLAVSLSVATLPIAAFRQRRAELAQESEEV